ncbi:MAG: transglutaminase family protein, partial [Gammaproteobacteria bacterium]|nr:transglutaminase family protein [Gammaproteobacteria bacterium]
GLPLSGWQLQYAGYNLPLHVVSDDENNVCIADLRYRDFFPWRGLYPYIEPSSLLSVLLTHPKLKHSLQMTFHNWCVDIKPYDRLPTNFDEARHRQDERLVISIIHQKEIPHAINPPLSETTGFTYDLRKL